MRFISSIIDKILIYFFKKNKRYDHIYKYVTDSILIEAGRIPHMAFRLLEGTVVVFKQNSMIGEFGPHTTWGSKEILNEQVAHYSVYIKKDSKVCVVGKSELRKTWIRFLFLFERDMLASI